MPFTRILSLSLVFGALSAFAVPQSEHVDLETSSKTTKADLRAVAPLAFDKTQTKTAKEIVKRLYSGHFDKKLFDDALSVEFLSKYLDMLDPSKMFFYQKDIDNFKRHATQFDDYFNSGDLNVAYEIYALYRTRVDSRLNSVIELLKDDTVEYTFNGDDSIDLDREDAKWLGSISEADELWHRRIKLSLLNLKMAGKTIEEAREKVARRYENQKSRIKQDKSADVFEIALNALTVLYDPHTNYWSPHASENFNINMSKSLEGIGAVLQSEDELTKVVRLVPGGPAFKQGQLKAADRIVAVAQGDDGELIDIVGWRLDEVVQLIRGPKNTVVKLEVLPSGEAMGGDTTIVKINRGKVKLEDQEAQKAVLELPGENGLYKLGVILLPDFYIDFDAIARRDPNFKSSTKDVIRLIDELKKEKVDGIILDLRNNGGGSLQEATTLTDLFIDRGVVVQIKTPDGRVGRQNQALYRAHYDGPLVVLVNRLSASASEIFAGAIQDYGRGLVIGSRTFGKGTVQSVKDLVLGRLKITESKFYRVSGDSTQHRGVVPDIHFPTLVDEDEVGESAYENALPWDQIHAVPHAVYNNFSTYTPSLVEKHKARAKVDPDFIYLLERIKYSKENQHQTAISLNEKVRNKRKKDVENKSLALENKRRVAKGLDAYEDFDALKEKEDEDESESYGNAKIDVDGDTLLIESGNILVDLIELQSPPNTQSLAGNKSSK